MRVLVNLLDCMDFKLTEADYTLIKENHTAVMKKNGDFCAYRGFMRALNFDKEANLWRLKPIEASKTEVKAKIREARRLSSDFPDKESSISTMYKSNQVDIETRSQLRDMIEADDSISNVGFVKKADSGIPKSNRSTTNLMSKLQQSKADESKVSLLSY